VEPDFFLHFQPKILRKNVHPFTNGLPSAP
jgi:hypothetical protein